MIIRPVYFLWHTFPDGREMMCKADAPHPINDCCYARSVPVDKITSEVDTLAVENELLEMIQRNNPSYKFERKEQT